MGLIKSVVFTMFLCIISANVFSQDFLEVRRIDSISIFFKFGSCEVENPQRLIARCNRIKSNSGKIRIVSYTDIIGSLKFNKSLASRRLSAITKIVSSTNLASFVIDSVNKNEKREANKSINDSLFRRVDIIIFEIENKFKFNSPINLNINFESGTNIIMPTSTENLEKLLSILKKDSTLQIQLNGHVCCQPKYELSLSRAEQVKKYLVSKGIVSSRIACKGYSNKVPLVSELKIEDRPKNMRVEVVFIK